MLRSIFWPEATAHRAYWERNNCALVYEYDPSDDGPEVEVATAILSSHNEEDLTVENWIFQIRQLLWEGEIR